MKYSDRKERKHYERTTKGKIYAGSADGFGIGGRNEDDGRGGTIWKV